MKIKQNPLYEQKKVLVENICKLIDSGLNTKQIAEKLNIPRSTVRNIRSGTSWVTVSKKYKFMQNKLRKYYE